MKLIDPLTVTDAAFNDAASTVPENDHPAWNVGTPYAVDDDVIMTTGVHRKFRCLITNTGQDPSTNPIDGSGNPYWLDTGATNRWAMFDQINDNPTTLNADIVFELTPGVIINSLSLINTTAESVTVVATSVTAGGEIYNETISLLSTENVIDAYTYAFSGFQITPDIVFENVPPYADAIFTVTVSTTTTASVGEFVYGTDFDLGVSLIGAQPGLESFSVFTEDDFGSLTITQRGFRKLLTIDTVVPTSSINPISRKMSDLLDIPVVWVGDPDNSSLIVYGIIGSYLPSLGVKGSRSFINFEIKGLR